MANQKSTRPHRKSGIFHKILRLSFFSMIPVILIAMYAIVMINNLYHEYDQSVANITAVNEYNVNFERDLNGTMYYLVVEAYDWNSIKDTDDPKNPYVMIHTMRDDFQKLRKHVTDKNIRNDIDAIDRMLTNLEKRIGVVLQNVEEGGHYDENMNLLQTDINVLTHLIQNDIEDYIYLEAENMEHVRVRISDEVQHTVVAMIVILIVTTGVTLLISMRISKKMTDPITELCNTTEQFAGGDFSVRFSEDSDDELATLGESFNSMVQEISNLVEDIRIEQKNAKDAELKLLQAQINPHFLYNTLDAIMWLTEAGENKQAVRMISSLSNFFRTTLSKGRDWITVAEEESHIRSYLEIQQFRYQDILHYEISIPKEMQGYYLMKLMLQPIVENALYHGIKNKRDGGSITVSGCMEDGNLIFVVQDDGIGMTEAELSEFRKRINGELEADRTSHGFGIANVAERIRLNYGEEYGIIAESTFGKGCTITVKIPAVKQAKEG